MNKKLKIALISLILVITAAVSVKSCMAILPKANMQPSDYDLGMTYEQASQADKPVITVFYADWCTYCKHFMPKLDKVRNINKEDFNVVLLNVDDTKNKDIFKEYRISGYPSVYIIDPKYDNRVHIDNSYLESVTSLNKEVQRYGSFRKLITKGATCK